MSEAPPPMSQQERSDMLATEGLRATRGPAGRGRDNTEALLQIMEQELDLVPMSEVTIVHKDAEGRVGTIICRKTSADITCAGLIEDGYKIIKVGENNPNKQDTMKRLWAMFSKSAIVNNFDVDRFYIVNGWGEAIMDAYSMGFMELLEEELNKFHLYIRSSQSYNGFTVTTFTQDNLRVEVPQLVEKKKRGLFGIGGDRREQP